MNYHLQVFRVSFTKELHRTMSSTGIIKCGTSNLGALYMVQGEPVVRTNSSF
ncbi:hypothetical protein HanXRQr2_Chr09g0371821 [Helianthus annuus]|uniref:Uncharacterized protein n=1 Tax=Helianthus annuus TaxID=4232 RepID=A0A9K3I2Z8_HELAN|nr:hypothetical protein HanXRQr2_Chr09g0371821 [Helianthus annuus]KAJ0891793.1 hypothetical protein HanPSC8_Chr09g0358251 [Helianthus annuus]